MRCSLLNTSDVALMAGFKNNETNRLRDVIIQPGEKCFYDDTHEIATDDTWDFVEWGLMRDEDEQELALAHNWAIEGF